MSSAKLIAALKALKDNVGTSKKSKTNLELLKNATSALTLLRSKKANPTSELISNLKSLFSSTLAELYITHSVPSLILAGAVIDYIFGEKISSLWEDNKAVSPPTETTYASLRDEDNVVNQKLWEEVIDAGVVSVQNYCMDHDDHDKEDIGQALYPPLARMISSDQFNSFGLPLRATVYQVLSDTSKASTDNIEILRDPKVLGGSVLGKNLATTHDYVVLDALLELITRIRPRSHEKSAQRGFSHQVYLGTAMTDAFGDTANELDQLYSTTRDSTQFNIKHIELMSKHSIHRPQSFVVGKIVVHGRSQIQNPPHNRLFIDRGSIVVNLVDDDGEFETLSISLHLINDIKLEKKAGKTTVVATLDSPPILQLQLMEAPRDMDAEVTATLLKLIFDIDNVAMESFRSTLDARGMSSKISSFNPSRRTKSSLSGTVLSYQPPADNPLDPSPPRTFEIKQQQLSQMIESSSGMALPPHVLVSSALNKTPSPKHDTPRLSQPFHPRAPSEVTSKRGEPQGAVFVRTSKKNSIPQKLDAAIFGTSDEESTEDEDDSNPLSSRVVLNKTQAVTQRLSTEPQTKHTPSVKIQSSKKPAQTAASRSRSKSIVAKPGRSTLPLPSLMPVPNETQARNAGSSKVSPRDVLDHNHDEQSIADENHNGAASKLKRSRDSRDVAAKRASLNAADPDDDEETKKDARPAKKARVVEVTPNADNTRPSSGFFHPQSTMTARSTNRYKRAKKPDISLSFSEVPLTEVHRNAAPSLDFDVIPPTSSKKSKSQKDLSKDSRYAQNVPKDSDSWVEERSDEGQLNNPKSARTLRTRTTGIDVSLGPAANTPMIEPTLTVEETLDIEPTPRAPGKAQAELPNRTTDQAPPNPRPKATTKILNMDVPSAQTEFAPPSKPKKAPWETSTFLSSPLFPRDPKNVAQLVPALDVAPRQDAGPQELEMFKYIDADMFDLDLLPEKEASGDAPHEPLPKSLGDQTSPSELISSQPTQPETTSRAGPPQKKATVSSAKEPPNSSKESQVSPPRAQVPKPLSSITRPSLRKKPTLDDVDSADDGESILLRKMATTTLPTSILKSTHTKDRDVEMKEESKAETKASIKVKAAQTTSSRSLLSGNNVNTNKMLEGLPTSSDSSPLSTKQNTKSQPTVLAKTPTITIDLTEEEEEDKSIHDVNAQANKSGKSAKGRMSVTFAEHPSYSSDVAIDEDEGKSPVKKVVQPKTTSRVIQKGALPHIKVATTKTPTYTPFAKPKVVSREPKAKIKSDWAADVCQILDQIRDAMVDSMNRKFTAIEYDVLVARDAMLERAQTEMYATRDACIQHYDTLVSLTEGYDGIGTRLNNAHSELAQINTDVESGLKKTIGEHDKTRLNLTKGVGKKGNTPRSLFKGRSLGATFDSLGITLDRGR